MSIQINMTTPDKKRLSELLMTVACMIAECSNKTITISCHVNFDVDKKDC